MIPTDHDCAKEGCEAVRSFARGRDLEWEVTHKKSRLYKGRGDTPEAALRDLRESFQFGVNDARENLEREQKRLDKLTDLLGDAAAVVEIDGTFTGQSPTTSTLESSAVNE